jgi:hypothetical protein
MSNEEKRELIVTPLIDHAIGALGDFSGDIGTIRRRLSSVRTKTIWSEADLAQLKESLLGVATLCHHDYEEWERLSNVKLP